MDSDIITTSDDDDVFALEGKNAIALFLGRLYLTTPAIQYRE